MSSASDGDEDGLVDDAAGGVPGDDPSGVPAGVPAGLVLAATPLGDSRDASARLRDALATADVVSIHTPLAAGTVRSVPPGA